MTYTFVDSYCNFDAIWFYKDVFKHGILFKTYEIEHCLQKSTKYKISFELNAFPSFGFCRLCAHVYFDSIKNLVLKDYFLKISFNTTSITKW